MSSRTRAVMLRGTNAIPPHVQGILNQEKRILQHTFEYLEREAAYNIRSITQQQQVVQRGLQVLQTKLEISKQRSMAVLHPNMKQESEDVEDSIETDLLIGESRSRKKRLKSY